MVEESMEERDDRSQEGEAGLGQSSQNQSSQNQSSQNQTSQNWAVQFLLGTVLGGAFPLICLSYVSYFGAGVTAAQIWIAGAIAVSCGLCSAIGGDRFLAQLSRAFETMPGI